MDHSPLTSYVSSRDPETTWRPGQNGFKLVSQQWKGFTWEHDVHVCLPTTRETGKTWVVHVTGGGPNDFDIDWSQTLADMSGCPVAILFQIPNQPLWEMTEDDLIAHTFEQFIASGDPTWPLLLPMVKSVSTCMDALQDIYDANNFVVFGASKRGWTSWLSASTKDPRVCGIAPMVFDHLDMPTQLEKQLKDWGMFSPMIVDYTSRELESKTGTERGVALVEMVDPVGYLKDWKVPVLNILAANDPYWTVDASAVYWSQVPGPKWLLSVPNLHHAFEMTEVWTPTLAAFTRMLSGGPAMSNFSTELIRATETEIELAFLASDPPVEVKVWTCDTARTSTERGVWTEAQIDFRRSSGTLTVTNLGLGSKTHSQAFLVETKFSSENLEYLLSSIPQYVDNS